MNPLHMVVDVAGLIAPWVLFLVVVWLGFALVAYGIDRWRNRRTLRVLTSEGLEAELKRLNERDRTTMLVAADDSTAANWLIRDSAA